MKQYEVGQVLYVLTSDNVVPCQVFEEIVRSTLSGKQITYKLKFEDALYDLDKVNGKIFTSLDEVKAVMMERVVVFVNKHINQAAEKASVLFGQQKAEVDIDANQQTPQHVSERHEMVLPDGRVAKVNIRMPT